MYREQLLNRMEVQAFEQSLMPHQKAVLGNGLSVLDQSVLEHNIVAVSRVYTNIYFAEIGVLLGIAPEQAEKVVARMITEKRLKGTIDQVQSLVEFPNGKLNISLLLS